MKRKLMAFILVFTMLASLSPAVAADEMSAQPTVEEILSEYHQKAFEAQTRGETDAASTWSRRSSKTLEQETVDTLTAAGYEAYNVTAENYTSLEETLQTDFSQLGLDPEGSYVVVISGENETPSSNSSRAGDLILPPHTGDEEGGDDDSFVYQYNGVAYRMRYVTITNADMNNNELYKSETAYLTDIAYFSEIGNVLSEYALSYAAEKAVEKLLEEGGEELVELVPFAGDICSVVSLLIDVGEAATQDPLQYIDPDAWILRATTIWVRSYIEIYDISTGNWYAVQRSTYVNMESKMIPPDIYDPETNWPMPLGNIVKQETVYSTYYANTATRKLQAVQAYLGNYILLDDTGDIEYYFSNPSDPSARTVHIFTHEDPG